MPNFRDDLAAHHDINKAFLEYVMLLEDGVISSSLEARKLVSRLNASNPNGEFEVVEAVTPDNSFVDRGEFLGYDVSCGFNLSYISNCFWKYSQDRIIADLSSEARIITERLLIHCRSSINLRGLFSTEHHAHMFYDMVVEINRLQPNSWDNPACYTIVKLQAIK